MRAKSPSFIAEFPLRTTPSDERAMRVRLDAARNIYNAALGEALRRLDLMRQSKAWQAARATPKGKERTDAFRAARIRPSPGASAPQSGSPVTGGGPAGRGRGCCSASESP